jgi:hypothetical protein
MTMDQTFARARRHSPALTLLLSLALVATVACKANPHAVAERVTNRNQLIGGPDALGDVNDLKLSNGKVRFIIQGIKSADENFSRGWGIYGGSLLDVDLARPNEGDSATPPGHDHFGEMFPAFFLEAIAPSSVEVGNDGSDGKPATIVVKGTGAPFISMARQILGIAHLDPSDPLGAAISYTNTYSLGPTDQYLTMTTSIGSPDTDLDLQTANILGISLGIPFGNVLLFGNKNNVFIPGAGFDLYYTLQDSYKLPARLPALPGVQSDIIATRTPGGVSYGVTIESPKDPETSYVFHNRAQIPDAHTDDMVVPFVAGSFTGIFGAQAPEKIPAGETFSYKTYLIVGQGDVGSVRDVAYSIKQQAVGTFSARVREEKTDIVVPGAMLLVLDAAGKPYSEYDPDGDGMVVGKLAPGAYTAQIIADNRPHGEPIPFVITSGKSTTLKGKNGRTITVPRSALVNVQITETKDSANPGRPLPAKVSIVGTSPAIAANDGAEPRKYLYNLPLGDRMLSTDGIPDDHTNDATRQFVERVLLSGGDGRASGEVLPGTYHLVVSRGPEYSTVDLGNITLEAGKVYEFGAQLKHVIDTKGYISADFHVHSGASIDGHIELDQRVLTFAAEGLEVLTATDHNIVTDYAPLVQTLGLRDFIHSTVGIEMTTLEMGHFNAFPLNYQAGSVTHGSFQWMNLAPAELFATLRNTAAIGMPDTVVQVNHPRDSILGYYHQFGLDADTGTPRDNVSIADPNGPAWGDKNQNFSWDFDAMEVFNGKRAELLHTYRMPDARPAKMPTTTDGVPTYWDPDQNGGHPGDVVRTPCKSGPTMAGCVYAAQPVAFPGSIEDWFLLLNKGGRTVASTYPELTENTETFHPVTATGNSDSHGQYFEEAGYPRNWVRVPTDEPRNVTDAQVAQSVKQHAVVLSNGPYVEVSLKDPATGKTAQVGDLFSTATPTLKLHVKVSAPAWIAVEKIVVYSNANSTNSSTAKPLTITEGLLDASHVVRFDQDLDFSPANAADAWVVVTAEADKTMFPVLTPLEQPPLQISDAISTIAGPLGLGADGMNDLRPQAVGPARPFAMTNPIWIDVDGDGAAFGRTAGGFAPNAASAHALILPQQKALPVITEHQKIYRSSNLYKLFNAWGENHAF